MSTAATGRPGLPADAVATIVRMARAGYTDAEIGRHLSLSAAAVSRKRRALGVAPGVPARLRIVLARRALSNGSQKPPAPALRFAK